MTRFSVAVALVLALSLAGCSFGGGVDGTSPGTAAPSQTGTAAPGTGTATPASPTPTAAPTTPRGPAPDVVSYPDGFGPDGVTDPRGALGGHTRALLDASNFSVIYRAAVVTPNGTTNVTFGSAVNTSVPAWRTLTAVESVGEQERYYENGTLYGRNAPADGETTYGQNETTVPPGGVTGRQFVGPVFADATWTNATPTTVGGERAFRYESDTLETPRSLLAPSVDPDNVTAFAGVLVVDESGAVRAVSYEATVQRGNETREYRVALTVDDVGETTVTKPSWVGRER